ncbi:hypothetical protein PC39_13572 [Salinisphaera sp. PC39]|uniref:hypothetical protein n=1 Tax=Salinisphaera sp. PC39 TaxID=1304156 RepID=UPI003342016B
MKRNKTNAAVLAAILTILGGLIGVPATLAGPNQDGQNGSKQQTQKDAALIEQIRTAGPASIVRQATVISPQGKVLQKGAGEWVCRIAGPNGRTPACLDTQFRAYLKARAQGKKPHVERVGVAYMLHGMTTADMRMGPHIMLVAPNPADFKGYPTEPRGEMPWVMKAGTPYAHLMLPVGEK